MRGSALCWGGYDIDAIILVGERGGGRALEGSNNELPITKFYCLRQVHLAENLLQATHTQDTIKTT